MKIFSYPKWLRAFYPGSIWDFLSSENEKSLYLTFDDGPEPEITPWILTELDKYKAKATFFCVGKNAKRHPELLESILSKGHQLGNHTMHHLNGYKNDSKTYVNDVAEADKILKTKLFRPPYGKLRFSQHRLLKKRGFKTVFWTFLSYDFNAKIPPSKIIQKAKQNIKPGHILVFHDSIKGKQNLTATLPGILRYFHDNGYMFKKIES